MSTFQTPAPVSLGRVIRRLRHLETVDRRGQSSRYKEAVEPLQRRNKVSPLVVLPLPRLKLAPVRVAARVSHLPQGQANNRDRLRGKVLDGLAILPVTIGQQASTRRVMQTS